jgi:two-component system response regulator LytT
MTKCLVVDDEQIACQIIEQYILQHEGLTLVGKCRNALEAFAVLEQQAVDLLFLDIEMPLVNGITFLKALAKPPQVIFTTAHADYALQGYELDVIDYLLKPFSFERFRKAVGKIKTTAAEKETTGEYSLVIKDKGGLIKLPGRSIFYIEASRDYMKIVTAQQNYLVHITMKNLEEDLPPNKFIRVHKSFIIAIEQIKLIKAETIILNGGYNIPLSTSYKNRLIEVFKKQE